jgi:translation initiation factor 2 subunit 2
MYPFLWDIQRPFFWKRKGFVMDYDELLRRAKKNMPQIAAASRFDMPLAVAVVVKRQTVIKNFSDIAKTLRRDPRHIAKFLFRELAVPGSINGAELVLQGKLSSSIINQRIKDYADEYVLCKECGKPDTSMQKEGYIIIVKCEACGARRSLKNIK